MKIGVISDTHTNQEYMEKVVEWLVRRERITALYHLGDEYEDVRDVADMGIDVVQVPGIYHKGYHDGTLPKKVMENVMGVRILLVHSIEKDITAQDRQVADIILHGHTHRPELKLEDGLLLMNPGHLKGPKDKNIDSSFGLLDIQNKDVVASILDMSFRPIQVMKLFRAENGLYKA
jgi:uncharacterized protein